MLLHERERLLLRAEEAAEALGISRARLYELLADRTIESIQIGRSRRIPVAALRCWVEQLSAQTS